MVETRAEDVVTANQEEEEEEEEEEAAVVVVDNSRGRAGGRLHWMSSVGPWRPSPAAPTAAPPPTTFA